MSLRGKILQVERLADLVRFILAPAVAKRQPFPLEDAVEAVQDALRLRQEGSLSHPPYRVTAARQLAEELRMIAVEARVLAAVGRDLVDLEPERFPDLPPTATELLLENFEAIVHHLDALGQAAERAARNRQVEERFWSWVVGESDGEPEN